MKNIKRLLSLSFVFVLFGLLFAMPIAKAEVNKLDVSITATLDGDNKELELVTTNLDYGTEIAVDFGSEETNHFAFWIVDGVVRRDLERDTTFTVTNDLDAVAVFTNLKTVTVFMDHNGKMLDSNYDESETLVEPSKVGYDFVGFIEVFNEDNVIIKKATYELKEDSEEVVIIFTNIANEEDIIGAEYNSIVELSEEDPTFTHWEEDGKVVSYNANYKFSALDIRELVAKTGGVKESIITLNELVGYRVDHTSYLGQVELHNGDVLVEHGLEVDGVLRKSSSLHPETNEFLISTLAEWSFVRAYAIVKNGETFRTIYDRELPPAITDAQIIYDFSELTEKGEKFSTNSELEAVLNAGQTHEAVVHKANSVYDGNAEGGDYPQTEGLLKFGASKSNGEIELELDNVLIKTVVVYAESWNDKENNSLDVNGNVLTLNVKTNNDPRLVFELDEVTSIINIKTTEKRAFVFKIELYGENADIIMPVTHTVTFDTLGGSLVDDLTVYDGRTIDKPADPTREGFNFVKWQTSDNVDYVFGTPVRNDLDLVAVWEAKVYHTVTFDTLGGSVVENQEVEHGFKAIQPDDVTNGELNLEGWYLEDTFETKWNFLTDNVEEDITLYAKWSTGDVASTATIVYGSVQYSGSAAKQNGTKLVDDLNIVVTSATTYWDESGDNAMRLGSSKNRGNITYKFDGNIKVTKVIVVASKYSSDNGTLQIGSQSFSITGTASATQEIVFEVDSLNIINLKETSKRANIHSITFEYNPN